VFVETNVSGTLNLLESCRAVWAEGGAEGCRFLHVSTDEVYGSLGADEAPFTEESPLRPNSPYAASKAAADCLVRSYFKTYAFPAMITRCGNNYGPRQHAEKLIPMVIEKLRRRERIPLYGDGLNVRDWIHVQDHCEALWRVLAAGRMGEVYNVGGGAELPNKRLVEMICDAVDGLTGSGEMSSKGLIEFVHDRAGHDRRYAVDGSKMKRELGWEPQSIFEQRLWALIPERPLEAIRKVI
jgi:dTDP-glucose 4,6-dehydratase